MENRAPVGRRPQLLLSAACAPVLLLAQSAGKSPAVSMLLGQQEGGLEPRAPGICVAAGGTPGLLSYC